MASDERTAAAVARVPLALGAVIRVEGASNRPKPFRLVRGSCVVGAGKKADLVVNDPEVSRRHVELSLVPEGVHVTDLGSRNGTYYLGQRVERMTLALGSRLRIGSSDLVLDVDPDAAGVRIRIRLRHQPEHDQGQDGQAEDGERETAEAHAGSWC